MKKVISMVLALIMLVSLSAVAFAEELVLVEEKKQEGLVGTALKLKDLLEFVGDAKDVADALLIGDNKLGDYRTDAKQELLDAALVNAKVDQFNPDEKPTEMNKLLKKAFAAIDHCQSTADVLAVKSEYLKQISTQLALNEVVAPFVPGPNPASSNNKGIVLNLISVFKNKSASNDAFTLGLVTGIIKTVYKVLGTTAKKPG